MSPPLSSIYHGQDELEIGRVTLPRACKSHSVDTLASLAPSFNSYQYMSVKPARGVEFEACIFVRALEEWGRLPHVLRTLPEVRLK